MKVRCVWVCVVRLMVGMFLMGSGQAFAADYPLIVTTSGAGTVTSAPAGINCGAGGTACTGNFAIGSWVQLTATPAPGYAFKRWNGACWDDGACRVEIYSTRSVSAEFVALPTTTNLLTVTKVGSGSVTSAPAGINCGAICRASFNRGSSVALTASPAAGFSFAGWRGACTGTAPTCTVAMSAAKSVTATFVAASPQSYTLAVAVTGNGTVGSLPAGISCGTDCTENYSAGTVVALTPIAASGSSFAGWSGACAGTGACSITMSQARSVAATFTAVPGNVLTVTKTGTGSGSVTSSPAGISCGTNCSAAFSNTASVVLTAAAASGSSFSGWGGACSRSAASCTVSMSAARTVTATFASSSAASGKTYYVATSGSDYNNGTSLTTPFRTLTKAVGMVSAGDIVEVRAGNYAESLTISRPGAANAWIILRGYNGERPVIRGTNGGPSIYFYHDKCDEDAVGSGTGNTDCQPMYWVVQGLEVQGSAMGGDDGNVIKIDTPKVRIQANRLCCSSADIVKLVRTSNDVEILDNEIWQDASITAPSTNAQGVDIVGADRTRVAGNYVHDVPNIGIYAKGNARNALFENNVLANIGDGSNGHALMLGQETDADRMVDGPYESYDGIVRNNVVVGASWACVAVASSFNARIYNNSCYDTGRITHGSILLSNESIAPQGSTGVEIVNNIIYGNAARPVIKIGSASMTDYKTLTIDRNLYFATGGSPRFTSDEHGFSGVDFASWKSSYSAMSGRADSSVVADPKYATTSASGTAQALTLSAGSPAIDAGLSTTVVPADRLGVARPQGSAFDMGAYEVVSGATPPPPPPPPPAGDTTPPTVFSVEPRNGASAVNVNASVTVTFGEAIDCSTVTTASFFMPGVSGSVSCSSATAVFAPASALLAAHTYTVQLTGSIKDLAGNALAATSVSFTTEGQSPPPVTTGKFSFLVYGDSRAEAISAEHDGCQDNAIHMGLVKRMAEEPNTSFVVHLGDMVAGFVGNTTNWVSRGACPNAASSGSFKELIAPLQNKAPAAGLQTFFFPVIGNHDDAWTDGNAYPDKYGHGFCDVFDPKKLGSVNHTQQSYFQDTTHPYLRYTDAEFDRRMCSKNVNERGVYSDYMYYSFDFQGAHFVVMRVNSDYYNLMESNCSTQAGSDYDCWYNKHQLDWLRYDLEKARAKSPSGHIFVFVHAPLVSSSDGHPENASWSVLLPEFSKYKVKTVFSGHSHVYERSYPVFATTANPAGVRDDAKGTTYIVSGGGGSFLAGFSGNRDPRTAFIPSGSDATKFSDGYHYVRVDVDGSQVKTTAVGFDGTKFDTTVSP